MNAFNDAKFIQGFAITIEMLCDFGKNKHISNHRMN